jgi:16S rRNA (guanine527-N7)-methyltransferase
MRNGSSGRYRMRLLDVGSGAGLPGVVIAICCPEIDVTCVDTVAKKAAFIQQVAATLQAAESAGCMTRVESLTGPFDVISSRAFASLVDFVAGPAPRSAQGASGWP